MSSVWELYAFCSHSSLLSYICLVDLDNLCCDTTIVRAHNYSYIISEHLWTEVCIISTLQQSMNYEWLYKIHFQQFYYQVQSQDGTCQVHSVLEEAPQLDCQWGKSLLTVWCPPSWQNNIAGLHTEWTIDDAMTSLHLPACTASHFLYRVVDNPVWMVYWLCSGTKHIY